MYKIMIADDEMIVRKGLVNLVDWKSLDCEIVFQAEDGKTVLENLDKFNPDILICDIKMPGEDGISIAKYIYERKIPTAVIILTGYADFSYARAAIQYDVVDYITKANVLEGIAGAVEKAKDSVNSRRLSTIVQDMELLRRNFLKSVIDGSLYDTDIDTGLSSYMIDLGSYHVVSVQFLPTAKFKSTEKEKFYRSLTNFFSMAFAGYTTYQIPLDKEHFCLIICGLSSDTRRPLIRACTDLAETLEGFMNLKVIIGISSLCSVPSDLPVAYQQANLFSNRFFMDHAKKVYTVSDSAEFSHTVDVRELSALLDDMSLELQKGHGDHAMELFDHILSMQAGSSMSDVKSTGILILNTCDKLLVPFGTSVTNEMHNPGLTDELLNIFLLEDFSSLMRRILSKTADFLKTISRNQNRLISDTMDYINSHYQKNITLLDIADAVHINSSYLSRTFKEHTGSTVISMLNSKKIEKAKELLQQNDLKIYEVAETIGMNDTTYFSHFFKKNTGMTPKEFRERCHTLPLI